MPDYTPINPEQAASILNNHSKISPKWTPSVVRAWMKRDLFQPAIGYAEEKDRWVFHIRLESLMGWIAAQNNQPS